MNGVWQRYLTDCIIKLLNCICWNPSKWSHYSCQKSLHQSYVRICVQPIIFFRNKRINRNRENSSMNFPPDARSIICRHLKVQPEDKLLIKSVIHFRIFVTNSKTSVTNSNLTVYNSELIIHSISMFEQYDFSWERTFLRYERKPTQLSSRCQTTHMQHGFQELVD